MLVRAFEVHVRRVAKLKAPRKHPAMARPDSNQTSRMSPSLRKSVPPHFGQTQP